MEECKDEVKGHTAVWRVASERWRRISRTSENSLHRMFHSILKYCSRTQKEASNITPSISIFNLNHQNEAKHVCKSFLKTCSFAYLLRWQYWYPICTRGTHSIMIHDYVYKLEYGEDNLRYFYHFGKLVANFNCTLPSSCSPGLQILDFARASHPYPLSESVSSNETPLTPLPSGRRNSIESLSIWTPPSSPSSVSPTP